jgi:hypothetical protein
MDFVSGLVVGGAIVNTLYLIIIINNFLYERGL